MKSLSQGQVGLVILLVMVVVSTIGLSVATRSTSEVTTSRQTQESARTFAAAESAIEKVLSESGADFFNFEGDTQSFSYDDLAQETNVDVAIEKQYILNNRISEGTTVEVDVAGVSNGQVLRLEWGDSRNCADNPPSLAVAIINNAGGVVSARYQAIGPCDHSDNFEVFDPSSSTYQGSQYSLRYDLTLRADDQLVRIIPIYNDTFLNVAGVGWTLPPQQFKILSTGQNQSEAGRETKAVEIERTRPYAPSILDYVVVSGTSIVK